MSLKNDFKKWCICLLVFKSIKINFGNHCTKDSCPVPSKKCINITEPLEENQPSIVYQRFQGRLGNQLNGYSMMLQLKKQYGYQPYLTNQTYTILNQMFESETIELPVLEETFCNIEEMPFKVFDTNILDLIQPNSNHSKGQMYQMFPSTGKPFLPPIYDERYKKFIKAEYGNLRHILKIHPKYVKMARQTFQKVAKKLNHPVGNITFVGIHHRQSDMDNFVKKHNGWEFKKDFFYGIMTKLRKLYPPPIAFLYVSDDMLRGKNLFRFEIKALKDLFFVGRGNSQKADDIGHDFALMVHSNHTISTWGSFSHWMAVLNHGEKYGVPAMHGFL